MKRANQALGDGANVDGYQYYTRVQPYFELIGLRSSAFPFSASKRIGTTRGITGGRASVSIDRSFSTLSATSAGTSFLRSSACISRIFRREPTAATSWRRSDSSNDGSRA